MTEQSKQQGAPRTLTEVNYYLHFKRTIKELIQFDDKKPEELESEFDHFDVDNSYPTSQFKGCNIVDLDFMYK